MLSPEEVSHYRQQGYLVARNAVGAAQLKALSDEVDRWIKESRAHRTNYGETLHGKARFDLEAGHSAEHPKLRRVANPVDISKPFQDALWRGPT